jgi:hypothetical protein
MFALYFLSSLLISCFSVMQKSDLTALEERETQTRCCKARRKKKK